jgi:2-alkenal reductase
MMITAVLVIVLSIGAVAITAVGAQDTPAAANPVASIYNNVGPSVVAIGVEKQATQQMVVPGFGQSQTPQIERGLGSGFVMSTDGYIITNDHVVDGATNIEVDFNDGTLARAHVVGTDPGSDIAVIQVENVPAERLHPINFGNSDNLYVGESVLAIGSPFGERWTLTEGIVSGLDRVITGLTNFSIGGVIQTDAAINPGNSGGPLLDMNGDVVGMNSQIATQSGSNSGVGFAVPSNLVQRIAQQLIANGFVQYSYLGIGGGDVTLDAIDALNLPNDTRGVLVMTVTPGSPADRAGLLEAVVNGQSAQATLSSADIITKINDHPLYGIADLITYLAHDTQPGDTVTLTVLRNGADQTTMDVHLVPRPNSVTS